MLRLLLQLLRLLLLLLLLLGLVMMLLCMLLLMLLVRLLLLWVLMLLLLLLVLLRWRVLLQPALLQVMLLLLHANRRPSLSCSAHHAPLLVDVLLLYVLLLLHAPLVDAVQLSLRGILRLCQVVLELVQVMMPLLLLLLLLQIWVSSNDVLLGLRRTSTSMLWMSALEMHHPRLTGFLIGQHLRGMVPLLCVRRPQHRAHKAVAGEERPLRVDARHNRRGVGRHLADRHLGVVRGTLDIHPSHVAGRAALRPLVTGEHNVVLGGTLRKLLQVPFRNADMRPHEVALGWVIAQLS